MKRLLLAVVAFFIASLAYCQTTVKFAYPEIEFKFKRCICSGNTAYIDFTILNNTKTDIKGILDYDGNPYNGIFPVAYDDEGNVYRTRGEQYQISRIDIAGRSLPQPQPYSFLLPAGVPVKMRVTLSGVDEYAAKFTMLKILFREFYRSGWADYTPVEIREIPIMRN